MMTRKMDFSFKDGDDFVFSDPETYETTTLAANLVGDAKNYLVENGSVTITFVQDKAVTLELPSSVTLTVQDAPDGIRGDSSNNVQKPIILETGITVRPPYSSRRARRSRSIRAPGIRGQYVFFFSSTRFS